MYDFYRHCHSPPKVKIYEFDMKIGDSVRIYESEDRFLEGKIFCIISQNGKIKHVKVDWDEFKSYYTEEELELEYKEGTWSWRPLHEGIIF